MRSPVHRCQRELVPFTVAALTLDRCATCALIWFDRGELGKLRNALAEEADGWAQEWAAFVRFSL